MLFSSISLSLNMLTLFLLDVRASPLTFKVWKEALQSVPSCNPELFGSSEVEAAAVVAVVEEEEAEVVVVVVGFVVSRVELAVVTLLQPSPPL